MQKNIQEQIRCKEKRKNVSCNKCNMQNVSLSNAINAKMYIKVQSMNRKRKAKSVAIVLYELPLK
jgi:hypothetical protein